MDLDHYYRGLAAEQLEAIADQMLVLSREAEQADAHQAAFHLADVSTQLLDIGRELSGERDEPTPPPPAGAPEDDTAAS